MDLKVCTKCKEQKPLAEFSKDSQKKDGLQGHCKSCRKKYYKENHEQISEYSKQYYQENREQRLEYSRQYRKENRKRVSECNKQWYQKNRDYFKQYRQENREQRLEYNRHYRKENREQHREYWKRYRQKNREKHVAWENRRRALKQDGVPDVLKVCPVEKERLVQIYKLRDLLTKSIGVEYHVDHIWPLSKGGPHWSGNLQIITAEENLRKGDKLCEETARVIQESLDEYCSPRQ